MSALVLAVALSLAAGAIWYERRLLGAFQLRYGPNRVGPFGLLQVVADVVKLILKEDWTPPFADRPIFVIAPAIIVLTVLISFALIPFGPELAVARSEIGLLLVLGMSSLGVYSIALGGWASNNKYALLGSLRGAAQMIAYEVFMGLSLLGVVMLSESFDLFEIVRAQQRSTWFVLQQPIGFAVFMIAGLAETRRLPFDLVEAETELVAGYHAEYSGTKFAMFFLGEYLGIILVSALISILFFGGWLGPFLGGPHWLLLKTFVFVSFFILMRGALPRPRYDQLIGVGWKILLPLSLLNLLITGVYAAC